MSTETIELTHTCGGCDRVLTIDQLGPVPAQDFIEYLCWTCMGGDEADPEYVAAGDESATVFDTDLKVCPFCGGDLTDQWIAGDKKCTGYCGLTYHLGVSA